MAKVILPEGVRLTQADWFAVIQLYKENPVPEEEEIAVFRDEENLITMDLETIQKQLCELGVDSAQVCAAMDLDPTRVSR